MNKNLKRFALGTALFALAVAPAQAQTGWGSLGIHTGWMNPAQHAKGPQGELGFDPTFDVGGSLDFWFGASRRWGLGFSGNYSGWNGWDSNFGGGFGDRVHFGMYDTSLKLRLASVDNNTRLLPWLSLGVGAVTVNPEDDPEQGFPSASCQGGVQQTAEGPVCRFTPADVLLHTDSQTEVAAVGALGLDWFVTPSVALSLEAKDYWTKDSPYFRLSNGVRHDGGHNLVFNGGLAFYWGRAAVAEPGFVREEPIIQAPAPAPLPAPAPAPAPPTEEMITVCVVEPQGFAVRTIDAIRVPSQNRVYVMRNGQRVAIETAHPASAPIYVRNASWYVADQPLVINLETDPARMTAEDRNRIELVLFGSPAQREASSLVFVGTIDGTPIYASQSDVAPFRARLDAQLRTSTDLATILRTDSQLARDFGGVSSYYVAVEPNCVFQPVSVTNFVRRTRG